MPIEDDGKQPFCLSLYQVGKCFNNRQNKKHPVSLFKGISFTIKEGETFGIMGPSGVGKTTLGKIMAGLEKPSWGQVLFQGTDISHLKKPVYQAFRRQVQMLFQDPEGSFNPKKTLRRSLLDVLGLIGCPATQREALLRKSMEEVGLSIEVLERYPYQLSGGMNQRAALARILLLKPDLIILDEPTSSLDVSVQLQILNLLKFLQKEKGLSYFLISHDGWVINFLCDKKGILHDGEFIY